MTEKLLQSIMSRYPNGSYTYKYNHEKYLVRYFISWEYILRDTENRLWEKDDEIWVKMIDKTGLPHREPYLLREKNGIWRYLLEDNNSEINKARKVIYTD